MINITRLFQLKDVSVSLEKKIFQVTTLISGLMGIILVVFNLFNNFPILLNIVTLILSIASFLFFYIARYVKFANTLIYLYVILILFTLSVAWFNNAGSDGPILIYFLFVIVIGIFISPPKFRSVFIVFVTLLICFLGIVEYYYPATVFKYSSREEKIMDMIFSTFLAIVVLGSLIIFIKNSYDTQHALLLNSNTTLEKTNEQLAVARDVAEKATYAKSYFLANMSHELRTPLNGIIGTTELLKLESLSPQQKELLHTLQSCSDVLLNIINDVLDVSKIEAGQLFLHSSPFTLQKTIKTVLAIANAQMNSLNKQLELDYHIEDGIADTVVGDENRLKQVLLNLVGNAMKFTEQGAITVTVEKEVVEQERQLVTFHISDTGIGIEENKISELFEPFKQVQSNYAREYGGTGLGLSICKKIIEMMHGEIWVKSMPGKGSTFSFRIPLQIANEMVIEENKVISAPALAKHDIRILLAEDNTMNQFVAKKLFGSLGYQVDIAETGLQVLSMIAQQQYHLIFMDMQMPVMDGLEATKQIVQQQLQHQPVVIAMTANALNDDEQACKKAGMKDFLSKPFTRDQLKNMLEKWVS